ncbi:MAG: polysaccharide biosynthesis C-terminal domain-containing protein, partial [Chloroflexota bacterium]
VQPRFRPIPSLNLAYLKSKWQYSGSNYLVALFAAAPTLLLPVVVLNLLGPESNAYFFIAWMMANVLSAIASAISNALFAEGVHFEDRLGEDVRKTLKFTFMVLVPLVVVLIAGGKWLLLIFGPGYSTTGLGLLQVVALSSLPIGVNYIYTGVLRVRGRLREMTIIWGFIAVATLVVSYLVAPVTGIIGIGYAWLGVHGSVAIYVTVVIRKQLRRGSI